MGLSRFPSFRKKMSDFLSQEDGKITKQNALALGVFMFGTVITTLKDVSGTFSHSNTMNTPSYTESTGIISVSHSHHASHSTHGSHGSHASHGSHSSHASHGSHSSHSSHGSHSSY